MVFTAQIKLAGEDDSTQASHSHLTVCWVGVQQTLWLLICNQSCPAVVNLMGPCGRPCGSSRRLCDRR